MARITSDDRKYNVVVFGVSECKSGTSRSVRQSDDLKKVCAVFSSLHDSLSSTSVKDHFRLGKFNSEASRPRPVLVKFVRSADVELVLSNAGSLSRPIFVKRDLSPTQRAREALLMKERWSIIQSGVPRASIKIRQSKIFVNDVLYGSLDSGNNFKHSAGFTHDPPTSEEFLQVDSADVSNQIDSSSESAESHMSPGGSGLQATS